MCMQVMIFDYDVHHGNGTNDLFFDDPSVLFVSTHQDRIFPGTGLLKDVGKGDGEGFTINLPLTGALPEHAFHSADGTAGMDMKQTAALTPSPIGLLYAMGSSSLHIIEQVVCLTIQTNCGAGDTGDDGIMAAFNEIVAPAAHRFQPEIILVCLVCLGVQLAFAAICA